MSVSSRVTEAHTLSVITEAHCFLLRTAQQLVMFEQETGAN